MKLDLVPAGFFLALSLSLLPALGQDAPAPAPAIVAPVPAITPAAAADVPTNAATKAAAVAEQQAVDEKFKQLAAEIETLRGDNQLLLDKLSSLKKDLQQISAEQARLAAGAITREDLKPLAQNIAEVDKRRLEDKDTIADEIKKSEVRIVKLIASAADSAPKPPVKPAIAPAAEDGFLYTVQAGDILPVIVAGYNDEFRRKGMKTITQRQVMAANPGVDWSRLKIGQQIVIPRPAQ